MYLIFRFTIAAFQRIQRFLLGFVYNIDHCIQTILQFSAVIIPFLIPFLYFQNLNVSQNVFQQFRVILGLLFLNTFHVFITLFLVMFLPEFRKLYALEKTNILRSLVLVFILSLPILLLRGQSYQSFSADLYIVKPLVFVAAIHHSLFQSYGIFRQENTFDKNDSRAYDYIKYLMVFQLILSAIGYGLYHTKRFSLLHGILLVQFLVWLVPAIVILMKSKKNYKLVSLQFLSKFFCFIFSYLNFTITLLVMIYHGLEYLLISRRLISKSSMIENQRIKFWYSFWAVLPLCFLIFHSDYYVPKLIDGEELRGAVVFVLAYLASLTSFLHYAMDRSLFRFSNPNVRSTIGHLIKAS